MRRRYIFIPLLIAIILAHVFEPEQQPGARLKVPVDTDEVPDFYMENLSIRHFDDQGLLKAEIAAPSLSHYSGQGQSSLVRPHIVLYAENDRSWEVVSDKGRILDSSQDIALEDNVQVRLGMSGANSMLMLTPQIYYEFSAHRIWNQSPVQVSSSLIEGSASGLLIDLNTEQFELHNNVEIRYKR